MDKQCRQCTSFISNRVTEEFFSFVSKTNFLNVLKQNSCTFHKSLGNIISSSICKCTY